MKYTSRNFIQSVSVLTMLSLIWCPIHLYSLYCHTLKCKFLIKQYHPHHYCCSSSLTICYNSAIADVCLALELNTEEAVTSGQMRRSCRQLNIPIPLIFHNDLNFQVDYQCSSCFLLVHSLITPLAACAHIPSAGTHPISGCEEPCLANTSAMSFPSIPMCPGTHTSWILLRSASFTREWWLYDCQKYKP